MILTRKNDFCTWDWENGKELDHGIHLKNAPYHLNGGTVAKLEIG